MTLCDIVRLPPCPLSPPLSRLGLDWDAAAPIQIRPWTSLHLPKEEGEREVILGQCLIINGDQTEEHLRGNPKRNLSRKHICVCVGWGNHGFRFWDLVHKFRQPTYHIRRLPLLFSAGSIPTPKNCESFLFSKIHDSWSGIIS